MTTMILLAPEGLHKKFWFDLAHHKWFDLAHHKWNDKENKTTYDGLANQNKIRNFIYGLTEKYYEKRPKELKPVEYDDLKSYLEKEVTSWKKYDSNDPAAKNLEKAVRIHDLRALATQIDNFIGFTLKEMEEIETKESKDGVELQYHVGNACAFLNKRLEDLRRYRKYLYEMI